MYVGEGNVCSVGGLMGRRLAGKWEPEMTEVNAKKTNGLGEKRMVGCV